MDQATARMQVGLAAPRADSRTGLPDVSIWECECDAALAHRHHQMVAAGAGGKQTDRSYPDPAHL